MRIMHSHRRCRVSQDSLHIFRKCTGLRRSACLRVAQTYDELNRLKTMSSTGACTGLEWTYDVWANRTHQTTTGGTCNQSQLTINTSNRIADTNYGYDSAGNMTSEPGKTYQYDAENRMVSIDNGCPSTLCYTYNAEGRRVRKIASSTTTEYIYGIGGNVVAEKVGTTWTVGYVFANGQLVAQYKDSTTYAVHKDHLGSTRLLTKMDKAKLEDGYDYYPYGEPIGSSGSGTKRKFTGHERDGESGLDYMGARYYTSLSGGFVSPDLPFIDQNPGNPQSWNLYHYARNNPLVYLDPSGRAAEESFCTLARCAPYEHDGNSGAPDTSWEKETIGPSRDAVMADVLAAVFYHGVSGEAASLFLQSNSGVANLGKTSQQAEWPQWSKPTNDKEARLAAVVYNETGGLRSTTESGAGSQGDLHNARVAVAEVALRLINQGLDGQIASQKLTRRTVEQLRKSNPEVVAVYNGSLAAARTALKGSNTTRGATHFFLLRENWYPSWAARSHLL